MIDAFVVVDVGLFFVPIWIKTLLNLLLACDVINLDINQQKRNRTSDINNQASGFNRSVSFRKNSEWLFQKKGRYGNIFLPKLGLHDQILLKRLDKGFDVMIFQIM